MDDIIGKRIKELIKALNITQTEFANENGISQSSLNHYINGRRKIPTALLKEISDKYEISIETLISDGSILNSKGANGNKVQEYLLKTLKSAYLLKREFWLSSNNVEYYPIVTRQVEWLNKTLTYFYSKQVSESIPIINSKDKEEILNLEYYDFGREKDFIFVKSDETIIIFDKNISDKKFFSISQGDYVLVNQNFNTKKFQAGYYCVLENDKYEFYFCQKIEDTEKIVLIKNMNYNENAVVSSLLTLEIVGQVYSDPFFTVDNQLHYYCIIQQMADVYSLPFDELQNHPILMNYYEAQDILDLGDYNDDDIINIVNGLIKKEEL